MLGRIKRLWSVWLLVVGAFYVLSMGAAAAWGREAGRVQSLPVRECETLAFDGARDADRVLLADYQRDGFDLVTNAPGGSGDVRLVTLCR